jgi:hypothetical protein
VEHERSLQCSQQPATDLHPSIIIIIIIIIIIPLEWVLLTLDVPSALLLLLLFYTLHVYSANVPTPLLIVLLIADCAAVCDNCNTF